MSYHSRKMRRLYQCGGNLNRKLTYYQLTRQTEHSLSWKPEVNHLQTFNARAIFRDMLSTYHDNVLEEFDPRVFHALLNDSSTPSYHEAMSGPDREGFWEAMRKEIKTLEEMGV